ncbi:MAG: hypothetical protein GX046_03930 [Tissierellia bacterium]|jgi:type IV secretory pathway VirB2 component (pilin)|nr:hypothetical protein [Tissierellia bacterium]
MDLTTTIVNLTEYVKTLGIPVAVLAIVIQGFKFFRGDGQGKAEAKDALFWIIVGLILIYSAAHIVGRLQMDMGW